jgi:hypothetical protein
MAFVATKKTAVAAGVVAGLSASGLHLWLKHHPWDGSLEQQFLVAAVNLFFMLVPALVSVIGLQDPRAPVRSLPRILLQWLIFAVTAGVVTAAGLPLAGALGPK